MKWLLSLGCAHWFAECGNLVLAAAHTFTRRDGYKVICTPCRGEETVMAASGALGLISTEHAATKPTMKEKNKTRKPIVEKMRRDRINASIVQLRKLLEQQFQLLQPDSKPEKADVLETAVQFLRQQQTDENQGMKLFHRPDPQEYRLGYSRCLCEALSYLSAHHLGQAAQLKFLNHFHHLESQQSSLSRLQSPPKQQQQELQQQPVMANAKSLWRPW